MGWRFRRSFKIAPGIRWNIGKRGTSWTIGPRGFKVNVSSRGLRRTISLPGTGLSHTKVISGAGAERIKDCVERGEVAPPLRQTPLLIAEASERISPFTDRAAVTLARRWAVERFPLVGRLLPGAVTSIERRPVDRMEATYTVVSRRVVRRTQPLPRKAKATGSIPDEAAFDPWSPEIEQELERTRTVSTCPECGGEGRHTCGVCGGRAEVTCDACEGQGRVVSERSGKLIKCRACGGDGVKRCSCRDGIVTCTVCNGKSTVSVWLAVEEVAREETRSDGPRSFDVSTPESAPNVDVVYAWSGEPNDLSDQAASLLENAALRCSVDPALERITGVSVKQLTSVIARLQYELADREGVVDVHAWTGGVIADPLAEQPLRAVRRRLRLTSTGALLAGVALVWWFASRHWYYAESSATGLLALLALVLPIATAGPVMYGARPRIRRSSGVLTAAAVPPLALMVGQAALFAATAPSLERARELRETGALAAAKREALAAAELNLPGGAALHDALQLELVKGIKNPVAVWTELGKARFFGAEPRREAEAHAVEYVANIARELQDKGQDQQSLAILSGVPDPFRRTPLIRQRVNDAYIHQAGAAWQTIRSKKPLSERLAACAAVKQPLERLQESEQSAASRFSGVEVACAAVIAEEAARVRQVEHAARAAQLRGERAARDAGRRYERALRAWAMAPLACGDGTLSPSCVCGQSSRRGCCSSHGGVSGCSQEYPQRPEMR
jgi:hypothetical protein